MRRAVNIAVVFLVIVVLAGCSFELSREARNGSGLKNNSTSEDGPIRVHVLGNTSFAEINFLFEEYRKKEPLIDIQYECLSNDKYYNVLKTKLVSGDGPDLFNLDINLIDQYEDAGFLEDLSQEPYMQNLDDEIIESLKATSSGKLYGVPMGLSLWGVYYNKDYFMYAGISDVPKTWQEFIEACRKLKHVGITPLGGGFRDKWPLEIYETCLITNMISEQEASNQEDLLSRGEMKYSDPKSYKRKILSRVSELAKGGYFHQESFKLNQEGGNAAFGDGKYAMLVMGPWATQQILNMTPRMNMGVFALPGNDEPGGGLKMPGGPEAPWFINKESDEKVKKAAKNLMSFICSREVNELYCNKTANFPSVKGVELKVENTFAEPIVSDFSKYLGPALKFSYPLEAKTPGYKAANDKFIASFLQMAENPGLGIDDTLKDCDKAFSEASTEINR